MSSATSTHVPAWYAAPHDAHQPGSGLTTDPARSARPRRRLVHVGDADGHGGGIAVSAVVGLDRYFVTGLCLEIERGAGLDLTAGRVKSERGRVRAFHCIFQVIAGRVRCGGNDRADVGIGRRVFRDAASQGGVGEFRGRVRDR